MAGVLQLGSLPQILAFLDSAGMSSRGSEMAPRRSGGTQGCATMLALDTLGAKQSHPIGYFGVFKIFGALVATGERNRSAVIRTPFGSPVLGALYKDHGVLIP